MRPLVEPHLNDLVPYIPGKPIEETERDYGITGAAKLASNENCLGPSPRAVAAVQSALKGMHVYPDAGGYYLKQRLAKRHAQHGVSTSQIVLGNGTNELIVLLARAFLCAGEALLNAWPSFVCYRIAARSLGRTEVAVPLDGSLRYDLERMAGAAADRSAAVKLVFLANPNNPTGESFGAADLDACLARIPSDVVVVLDEAYAEYVARTDYPDGIAWVMRRPRTVVLRTFSKVFGLASLRIGYAVCDPDVAQILERLRDAFNTSGLAQSAALAALDDTEHVERSRAHNATARPALAKALTERGFDVTPSEGNFVLATIGAGWPEVPTLNEQLLRRGLILRPVANYGLPQSLRITVGTTAENARLLAALDDIAAGGAR